MNTENPWAEAHRIEYAHEIAKRNGFYLKQGRENNIEVKATPGSGVWADDVVVVLLDNFREVCCYFGGYEKALMFSAQEKIKLKGKTK